MLKEKVRKISLGNSGVDGPIKLSGLDDFGDDFPPTSCPTIAFMIVNPGSPVTVATETLAEGLVTNLLLRNVSMAPQWDRE